MAETCKSCGKAWTDHLGVEPTCALLVEAVAILKKLREPTRESLRTQSYGVFVCVFCGKPQGEGHFETCEIYERDAFLEKMKRSVMSKKHI